MVKKLSNSFSISDNNSEISPNYSSRNCPICGIPNKKYIKKENEYELMKCSNCRFIYTRNPIDEVSKIKYYAEMADSSSTLKPQLIPSHYNLANQIKSTFLYSNVLKHILKIFPSGPVNIFDVGCSGGLFLISAQIVEDAFNIGSPSRFNCTGIAFDPREKESTEYHSGCISFLIHEIPDIYYNSGDCVTLLNVLEHVNNPDQILQIIKRLLKCDGILVIDLPNNFIVDLRGKLFKKYPDLAIHEHINHFTPSTLDKLLRKNGFVRIKIIPGLLRGASGFGKPVSVVSRLKYLSYLFLFYFTFGKIYLFPHLTTIYKKIC